MNDMEIRLECLRIASIHGKDQILVAKDMYNFVLGKNENVKPKKNKH